MIINMFIESGTGQKKSTVSLLKPFQVSQKLPSRKSDIIPESHKLSRNSSTSKLDHQKDSYSKDMNDLAAALLTNISKNSKILRYN